MVPVKGAMGGYFQVHNLYDKLIRGALAELEFLKLVDNYPSLYGGPILDNAIRRYECFWLPLVAKYTDDSYERRKDHHMSLRSAPIDVAWVWHVHMLAPLAYQQDCTSRFKRVLHHDYRSQDLTIGRQLWQEANLGEPFDVDLVIPPQHVPGYSSQLHYDIRSAAQRQSKFYYNVSLPHYKDPQFLESAVDRYKHHLKLKKSNPQLFAVPCYDFDLIWHAHQLYPLTYLSDMMKLLGFVLNHDDTETGRVPGSKLYDSEMQTREAWSNTGMSFSKRGAMYRGEPLPKIPAKPGRFSSLAALTHDFEVELVGIDTHLNPEKRFEIVIKSDALNSKVKKVVREGKTSFGNEQSPLCTYSCNSLEELDFLVILYHKRWFGRKMLQFCEFSLKGFLIRMEKSNFSHLPATVATRIEFTEGDVKVRFRVCKAPVPKNFKLTAVPEPNFVKVPHVAQVLSQPALMVPPKKIQMPILPGEMTTNQIRDRRGQVVFNCKIVHSAECMLSAVEILDVYDNLEATAHVLDIGAFPEADEVSNEGKDCITVASREGARAMLIRSRDEDYGVCMGKWIKREIRTRRGRKKDVSFMGVKFYSLKSSGQQGWCKVKKLKNSKFLVVLRSDVESCASPIQMKVDLDYGLITIPYAWSDDIPQGLAIAFAIAMLHVLCRPYSPKNNQSAAPLSRRNPVPVHRMVGITNGSRIRRRSLSNDSLVLYATPCMMLAAGYMCMTVPTNVYVMSCAGHIGWDFCPNIDANRLQYMDYDGDWGDEFGFDDPGDNITFELSDTLTDDWGDGGFAANVDDGEGFNCGGFDYGGGSVGASGGGGGGGGGSGGDVGDGGYCGSCGP